MLRKESLQRLAALRFYLQQQKYHLQMLNKRVHVKTQIPLLIEPDPGKFLPCLPSSLLLIHPLS